MKQKIILHRGNTNGGDRATENEPHHIESVVSMGYDVEVDLWYVADGLFLGHDAPMYKIPYDFLLDKPLWIHCKNKEALMYLFPDNRLNVFLHEDGVAITSSGHLWVAPGGMVTPCAIACMPELVEDWDISEAYGICTDYPSKYQ